MSATIFANSIPSPMTIKSTSLIFLPRIKSLTTPPTPYTFLFEVSAIFPTFLKIERTSGWLSIKSFILSMVEINTIILEEWHDIGFIY